MSGIIDLLKLTLSMSTPFMLVTMGGIFCARCGISNFTYEGIMIFGAFTAIALTKLTGNVVLSCFLAIIVCVLVELFYGVFVLEIKGRAVFIGIALNLLAASVVPFILRIGFGKSGSLTATDIIDPAKMVKHFNFLDKIPIIGPIFNDQTVLTYLSFLLLIFVTILIYRTKFGTYVRVSGENEDAAVSLGIKVKRIRYISLAIAAVFCGLAGINLAVESLGMYTDNMTASRGYICLSAVMCGRGRPVPSTLFALLFGCAKALQIRLNAYVGSAVASLIGTLPYVALIAVLVITELPKFIKDPNRIERNG